MENLIFEIRADYSIALGDKYPCQCIMTVALPCEGEVLHSLIRNSNYWICGENLHSGWGKPENPENIWQEPKNVWRIATETFEASSWKALGQQVSKYKSEIQETLEDVFRQNLALTSNKPSAWIKTFALTQVIGETLE